MDRTELITLIETEVRTAAEGFADAIFEPLGKQVADQVEERVSDFLQNTDADIEELARNIIQPAFTFHVHRVLEQKFKSSAVGWHTVLWANLAERYNQTGAV